MDAVEKERATWVEQILQERWLAEGDRGTQLFFKTFKSMSTAKHIPALTTGDGRQVTAWTEMADVTVNFFQQILGELEAPGQLPPDIDVTNPILDVVQDSLLLRKKSLLMHLSL